MRQAQFLLLSCLLSFTLVAQPGSITAEEVNFEKAFIEAKREALLGNTDAAIAAFQALTKEAPDQDVLFFELGRLYFTQEKNNDAVEALEKAYGLNSSLVYAHLLGDLYLATGQNKEGAKLYGELVKQKTDEPDFYLQQALFLVRAQQIDKAIDVYDELESRLGVNAELSRRKHALYLGEGDKKRAEKELRNLIDAFPQRIEYRHLLAGYYISQNEKNAAKRTYEEILSIEPADVKAQLALQNDKPGAPTAAMQNDLMKLFGRADVDVDLKVGKLLPLVQAVANTNDRRIADEGLALAAELRRVHPDEAKGWAITGDLHYHTQRYQEAAAAYQSTLELDDTVYPVWEQLLHALYLDNQQAELRKTAENALDIYPNRPYLYFYAALGEVARSDYEEASSLMQQAEFIFGATKPAATTMVRAYQGAFKALQDEQTVNYGELGQESGPFITYFKAKQAAESDNFSAVIELLDASSTASNTNAAQLELLGDAYLATGQKDKANSLFTRAKQAGSVNSKLNAKISQTRS